MNGKISWTSAFEIGINDIDTQHQELVAIINELADGIGPTTMDGVAAILDRLKDYATYHFMTEEQIMSDHQYADFPAHVQEHAYFIDQLQLFDLDVILASEGLAWDMQQFLREWLVRHILTVDRKFAASLKD